MEILIHYLPYIQVVLAITLIVSVLLQRTGSGLGGAFGGDNLSSGFHTRRGVERSMFRVTIVIGVLFAISAFAEVLLG